MLSSCIVMSSTLPYIKLIFAVPLTLMKLKRAPMKEMKSREPWGQLSIPPHLSPLRDSVLGVRPKGSRMCSFIQWSVICVASQWGLTNLSIGQPSMALCCLAPHLSATGQRVCVSAWKRDSEGGLVQRDHKSVYWWRERGIFVVITERGRWIMKQDVMWGCDS